VEIGRVVALGGIAKKSPFVMQTMADVLNMPIEIVRSEQACALGAAMFAAVVAGVHDDVATAQQAMGDGVEREYDPIPENVAKYAELYARYASLGDFIEKEMAS